MRTTLQIDDDVLSSAREISHRDGRSVGAVISELARRSLRPSGLTADGGFPVFDIALDAPTFTDADVARARDED